MHYRDTVVNENGVLRVSNVETVNTKNTGETYLEFVNTYVLDGEDAGVIAFTNIYTPTYAPEPNPEPKPEPKPESENSTSPQTGDNANIGMWVALLFVSGGVLVTLTVVDKKACRKAWIIQEYHEGRREFSSPFKNS